MLSVNSAHNLRHFAKDVHVSLINTPVLVNNQPDVLFLCIYLFISSLYMFRASSAHHREIELY